MNHRTLLTMFISNAMRSQKSVHINELKLLSFSYGYHGKKETNDNQFTVQCETPLDSTITHRFELADYSPKVYVDDKRTLIEYNAKDKFDDTSCTVLFTIK